MRAILTVILASLMIIALPGVAAEDPTYERPDPADVQSAAETLVADIEGGVDVFSGAALAGQEAAQEDLSDFTLPASHVAGIAAAGGQFGASVVGAVIDFRGAMSLYAAERVENKTAEAWATADAAVAVAEAGILAGDTVADASVRAVCDDGFVEAMTEGCADESVLTTAQGSVEKIAASNTEEAGYSTDRGDILVNAVKQFLSNFVPVE